jgi:hypothetical protein
MGLTAAPRWRALSGWNVRGIDSLIQSIAGASGARDEAGLDDLVAGAGAEVGEDLLAYVLGHLGDDGVA